MNPDFLKDLLASLNRPIPQAPDGAAVDHSGQTVSFMDRLSALGNWTDPFPYRPRPTTPPNPAPLPSLAALKKMAEDATRLRALASKHPAFIGQEGNRYDMYGAERDSAAALARQAAEGQQRLRAVHQFLSRLGLSAPLEKGY